MPVIRLNTVVFPAPFGPITLIISFGKTSRSRSCTAARPPKCLETLVNFSRGQFACSTPIVNSRSLLLNAHLRFEARRSWYHIQRTYLHSLFFNFMELAPPTRTGDEPLGPVDHNHNQNDTKEQISNIAEGETSKDGRNSIVNCKEW